MPHAHLLEIRELQLTVKNVSHKGVDFYVENDLNSPTRIFNSPNFFPEVIPRNPRQRGRERRGRKRNGAERRAWRGRVASWLSGDGRP